MFILKVVKMCRLAFVHEKYVAKNLYEFDQELGGGE